MKDLVVINHGDFSELIAVTDAAKAFLKTRTAEDDPPSESDDGHTFVHLIDDDVQEELVEAVKAGLSYERRGPR